MVDREARTLSRAGRWHLKGGGTEYSERAKLVLARAQREAQRRGNNYIGTGHILLGIMQEADGDAFTSLMIVRVPFERVTQYLNTMMGAPRDDPPHGGSACQ